MGLFEFVAISLCLNVTCPPEDINVVPTAVYNEIPIPESLHTDTALLSRLKINTLAQELKGKHLRITTIQNPPLSYTVKVNNTLVGKGIAFDCINFIRDKYEFTYSIVLPQQDVLGDLRNKGGLFEMLAQNKADVSAAFLPVLPRLWGNITYSTNLDVGEFVVMMKRPKESATGSGLLAPFTTPVWVLIILSLLVVGPLIHFIIFLRAKLCSDDESKIYSLQSCMWFVYGALLKQGTTLSPTTDSSRLLFATWWIFITILTAYYTANLTAFLTLSRFTLPINAPGDIAQNGYKWVTKNGSTVQTYNEELDAVIRNKFLPSKQGDYPKGADDEQILKQFVKTGKAVYVRERTIVNHLMYQDYLKKTKEGTPEEDRCTYVVTTFSIFRVARAFGYSPNFAFRQIFDHSLQHLVQSGVLNHMNDRGLPDTKICPLNLGSKERRLKNGDLFMTYVIVGTGFVISLTIFLTEYIYCKWHSVKAGKRKKKLKRLFDKVRPVKRFNDGDSHKNNNNNDSNSSGLIDFAHNERELLPPPPYHALFQPPFPYSPYGKKKYINGREYWVIESKTGDITLIPVRQPSALLFHYTN